MSPTYLVEHAEAARIALDLAEREAAHLRYTYNTLFGEPIDRSWPAFARLLGGQAESLVDTLAYAERMEWVSSGEEFVGARKLRNLLVHEYMTEPDLFLDALLAAKPATQVLFQVIQSVKQEELSRGLGAL